MRDEVSMLLEPVRVSLVQLGEFLPKLIVAVIVLVIGWLVAKAVRFAVPKACARSTSTCDRTRRGRRLSANRAGSPPIPSAYSRRSSTGW